MRRVCEIAFFVALATVLHLAAALLYGRDQAGAVASGEGGEALVSLEASSAQIATLVETWERPPEVSPTPVARSAPRPPQPLGPQRPQIETRVAETPLPPMPELALPRADTPDMPAPPRLPRPPEPPQSEPARQPRTEPVPVEPDPPVETATPETSGRPPARPETPRDVAQRPEAPTTPSERSQPASADSAAQRAAGAGGGSSAGAAGAQQSASLSPAQRQSLMAQWGASIRARVERRKQYPRAARGATGTVHVTLRISANGSLQGLGLAGSSGIAALDQAAVEAVRRAGRFPAAPDGLKGATHMFTLPMAFAR